jgi:hypothetical protein
VAEVLIQSTQQESEERREYEIIRWRRSLDTATEHAVQSSGSI